MVELDTHSFRELFRANGSCCLVVLALVLECSGDIEQVVGKFGILGQIIMDEMIFFLVGLSTNVFGDEFIGNYFVVFHSNVIF